MTVRIEDTEIFDQPHQMWAEGSSEVKPDSFDVEKLLAKRSFLIYDLDIFFDHMQSVWRWHAKIIKG